MAPFEQYLADILVTLRTAIAMVPMERGRKAVLNRLAEVEVAAERCERAMHQLEAQQAFHSSSRL